MNRLLPFIFILLALALFFGYVRPTWDGEIAQAKNDIANYDSALAAASNFSDNEAKLEQERAGIPSDQIDRLAVFLPDSVDNVQLILDLNALAQRSGVVLSNFTTAASANSGTTDGTNDTPDQGGHSTGPIVDSLTVSVSATGTYDAFRTFLASAEQSLRPLDVTQLSVTDSDTGVYTYQVSFKIYWLH
ncbi:MAG TPA: hypothetical protein VHB93_00540 [Candidatus Paceibacterota bacterium]|nr:hypothetical protein [Candidatus Paceibacterota bacterium]